MNSARAFAVLFLIGLFALPGCGNADGEVKTTGAAEDPLAAKSPRKESGPADDAPPVPDEDTADTVKRDAIRGRWLLRLTLLSRGIDFPLALVDVAEDGKSAKVVEKVDLLEAAKVDDVTVDGNAFHMRATIDDGAVFDARGELRDGIVWGNATIEGRVVLWPIRLLATEVESLEGVERGETAGRDAFVAAMQADTTEGFEEFTRKYASSPLAMAAQQNLLMNAKTNEATAEQVEARVQEYRKLAAPWGERSVRDAVLTSALILAETGYQPQIARRLVGELEKDLGENPGDTWTEQLAELGRRIDVFEARAALETGNDEAAKANARATLAAIHEKSPTDPTIAYTLATDAEKRGEKEQALKLYAELTALPGLEIDLVERWQQEGRRLEPPSDLFGKLWDETHPDADREARDTFLNDIYANRTFYFQGDAAEPRSESEGNQTVLVELFTGAQCPGCAMADIAISGAQRKYPTSDVIALRYHQHIPRPDPFATPTSETRFDFYEGQGTPTIVVNGKPTLGIGGTQLSQAEPAYELLMAEIEPEFGNRTDVAIDLSARADGETLKVNAKVSGLDTSKGKPRLRIAIAEEAIDFPSRNGVRVQEMVVRWMLPDAAGIAPKDGELTYEGTFELPALKQQLVDALDDFEKAQNVEFVSRPMDLADLQVVAFVQDDTRTKDGAYEVLQATVAPLEGSPVFDVAGPALEEE